MNNIIDFQKAKDIKTLFELYKQMNVVLFTDAEQCKIIFQQITELQDKLQEERLDFFDFMNECKIKTYNICKAN